MSQGFLGIELIEHRSKHVPSDYDSTYPYRAILAVNGLSRLSLILPSPHYVSPGLGASAGGRAQWSTYATSILNLHALETCKFFCRHRSPQESAVPSLLSDLPYRYVAANLLPLPRSETGANFSTLSLSRSTPRHRSNSHVTRPQFASIITSSP